MSQQIADQLLEAIEAGDYPRVERLASARELTDQYGVGVSTAQRALRSLVAEDRAVYRHPVRYFVA